MISIRRASAFGPRRLVSREPDLQIRADGTVVLGVGRGQLKRVESRIGQERLQEILRYVIDDHKFFQTDWEQLREQLSGRKYAPTDGAMTSIFIQVDDKQVSASVYMSGYAAKRYPELKELQRFCAVERMLFALRSEIYAGGEAGLAKYLSQANERLRTIEPETLALTIDDLAYVIQLANGDSSAYFHREEALPGGATRTTYVSITLPVEGEPVVSAKVSMRQH